MVCLAKGEKLRKLPREKNLDGFLLFPPNFPRGFAAHLRARGLKFPATQAMSLSKVHCVLPPRGQFSYFCLTKDHEAETEADETCLWIVLSLKRSY